MNALRITLTLAALASCAPAAADATCAAAARHFPAEHVSAEPDCVCDERLENLRAPLRKPFKVVAACRLLHVWGKGSRPLHLGAERVALDRWAPRGGYIGGEIYVAGESKLTGELWVEAGNAGTFFFDPDPPIMNASSGAASEFNHLRFAEQDTLKGLSVPEPFASGAFQCFTANATIWVRGLRVQLSETDGAGAWPTAYKVLHASGFKQCPKQ